MEQRKAHARTVSEEALLSKQLAAIANTMAMAARERDEAVRKRGLRAVQGNFETSINSRWKNFFECFV